MKFRDLFSISFCFIRTRFLESLMVILGLALGVAIISSLFSLVRAYNYEMKVRANNPEQREIRVETNTGSHPLPGENSPAVKIGNTRVKDVLFDASDLARAVEVCPDVENSYISFGGRMSVTDTSVLNHAKINEFECRMVSPSYFSAYNMEAAAGSFFSDSDIRKSNSVIILDKKLASKLFPDKDYNLLTGKKIVLSISDSGENFTFTIIGVLEYNKPVDNRGTAYCPYIFSHQYRSQQGLGELSFYVSDIEHLKNAVCQINNYFTGKYGKGSIMIHSSLDWEKDQKRVIIPIFSIITLFVGAGLLMAALNILNLMLARITRQRKNIGIMLAVGASRFDVFKLFLTESLTLGILGGAAGCFIAFFLSRLLQMLLSPAGAGRGGGPQLEVIRGSGPEVNVTLSIMAVALLLTLLLNAVFGIYPAYKASKTEPADTLRGE